MASGHDGAVAGQIRALFEVGTSGDLSDRQLLELFRHGRCREADVAFAAIVERHGPLVLRVCRGVLSDAQEAQDAFQATFLILLRKAKALWVGDSLAPWLHRVAYRAAMSARTSAARRRRREQSVDSLEAEAPTAADGTLDREDAGIVLEEVDRLPESYRIPIILCDLEGYSHEQAARRLNWPVGTVKSRQARGRERLRGRLIRRGLAPSALILGGAASKAAVTSVPPALAASTLQHGMAWLRNGSSTGAIPAHLASLTRGVLTTMYLARLPRILVASTLLASVTAGVGTLAYSRSDERPSKASGPPTPISASTGTSKSVRKPTRDLLQEAAKAVQQSPDPQLRAYTLAVLAKAQDKAGDREGALASARQAISAALELDPDKQCWALIAIAWARDEIGDRKGALDVLRLARKSASALKDDDWRLTIHLQHIATSQYDLGDSRAAELTLKEMGEISPHGADGGRFRPADRQKDVVKALAHIGDFDGVFRIIEAAAAGDQRLQCEFFHEAATAILADANFYLQPHRGITAEVRTRRLKFLEQVIKAVDSFDSVGDRPYTQIADAMVALGDIDSALRLVHRIDGKPSQGTPSYPHVSYVLADAAAQQSKLGQKEAARQTFREAVGLARRDLDGTDFRDLEHIALKQAEAGELAEARRTVESLRGEPIITAMRAIAKAQRESGDRSGAAATLRDAIRKAEGLLRELPRTIDTASEKGPAGGGSTTSLPEHVNRDRLLHQADSLLRQISAIHATLGDFRTAGETMNSIESVDDRLRTAMDIAEARVRAGDQEGAIAWALMLQPERVRVGALRGLAMGVLPVSPEM